MEILLIILGIYSFSITMYLIFMEPKTEYMYHDKVSIGFIFGTENKQHYILFNGTHFETSLVKKEGDMIGHIRVWNRGLDESETKVIVDNYNGLINKTGQ